MSWWVAGAMTVASVANANSQRKAQQDANQKNAQINAAQMEYSPWTGVKPGEVQMQATPNTALASGLQGGLSGAMFAKKNGFGSESPAPAPNMSDDQLQKSNPDEFAARQKARGF